MKKKMTMGMSRDNRVPENANDFVKKQQAMLLSMGGRPGRINPEMKKTGAYMNNSARSSLDFSAKLASSMSDAYPVRGRGRKK